jgi:hypothetical protein
MNRILSIAFALLLFYGAASCSDSQPTDSGNKPDTTKKDTAAFVGKAYDFAKGGLQILKIYYDQTNNDSAWGFKDEVIAFMTDKPISTSGWYFNAGDEKQNYALPASIDDTLFVYTHTPQGKWQQELGIGYVGEKWIWNNSSADIAILYNKDSLLVDTLSYELK